MALINWITLMITCLLSLPVSGFDGTMYIYYAQDYQGSMLKWPFWYKMCYAKVGGFHVGSVKLPDGVLCYIDSYTPFCYSTYAIYNSGNIDPESEPSTEHVKHKWVSWMCVNWFKKDDVLANSSAAVPMIDLRTLEAGDDLVKPGQGVVDEPTEVTKWGDDELLTGFTTWNMSLPLPASNGPQENLVDRAAMPNDIGIRSKNGESGIVPTSSATRTTVTALTFIGVVLYAGVVVLEESATMI